MIRRDILENPDEVIRTFDFFNDFQDTRSWLLEGGVMAGDVPGLRRRLEAAFSDWQLKRAREEARLWAKSVGTLQRQLEVANAETATRERRITELNRKLAEAAKAEEARIAERNQRIKVLETALREVLDSPESTISGHLYERTERVLEEQR